MEKIELNFQSNEPLTQQIVHQIETQLMSGKLKSGDQLPTVRELAQELEVSFNTVARAYRLMDEANLISTQQGRGTFILELPAQEESLEIRKQALEKITQRYLEKATQLGFDLNEILAMFELQINMWQESNLPEDE